MVFLSLSPSGTGGSGPALGESPFLLFLCSPFARLLATNFPALCALQIDSPACNTFLYYLYCLSRDPFAPCVSRSFHLSGILRRRGNVFHGHPTGQQLSSAQTSLLLRHHSQQTQGPIHSMSATAVNLPAGSLHFWQTTVGKKAIMAVTGFILFGFICGHLLGNLQIFLPPEKINHYSAALKSLPALLWGARITLLLAVGLHIWSAFELWLLQRDARPINYVKKANLNSTYASRTMLWSGPIILAFLIFYLLYHGLWSMFQSLGFSHPAYTPWLRGFAKVFAILIAAGNISIPVAV